ncbi:hypothetical protein [Flavobacterium sp.]|uniref:hypothetical protein n=1 Tax=Flavobacterium sp. TaxID=239 RepID=UPI00248A0B73|nr:hypothetical protein [Flavobacterium sp.]MDI1315821.1 hypothetical protein [Flavobacterium sp.]
MKRITIIYFLILQFTANCILSQNQADENQSKIAAILDNYFDLEREAIHLHLDKSTFLNTEEIWYQGYIINRKTNKPYFTTNVFVLLFDETGKQLSEKLVFASNGAFSGKIELDPKLDSGNYYVQVYTNWMNNFSENESTITKVSIINPEQGLKVYNKVNVASLDIFLNPEGKSLIKEVSNTIGVQVKDCRGNSPENLDANIVDSNGEIIKTIKLNRFGLGKFDLIPTNEIVKVTVNYGSKTLEKTLPNADLIGVSIEANTFSIENKTAIKIKTNKASADVFNSKRLNLVVHQDQKVTMYPFEFKPNEYEKTFLINNSDLEEGINTLRIIDNDLKQWSERSVFISSNKRNDNFNVLKNKRNQDKISLIGYSDYPKSIVSISVLPEDSKSNNEDNSIIAGITINPYLNNALTHANYYLVAQNRLKLFELDLVLMNEAKSKYNWDSMKLNPPTSLYSFDIGINLKGTIDASTKDKTSHKVNLVTYKDMIVKTADVSEKGEYLFENLVLTDSTLVNLTLQKLPSTEELKAKLIPQILNRKKQFNKPITDLITQSCTDNSDFETIVDFDIPKIEGKIINLDAVVIKKKSATPKLEHGNILANTMLRGFKIDQSNNHSSLMNFIEYNGFNVLRDEGNIKITVRQKNSLNLPDQTPLVYVNDRMLFNSYDEIEFMKMIDIEEIYIDSHAIVASMNNNHGIIKIYTKRPKTGYFSKPNPNSFFIKEAFSENVSFKNAEYDNTQTKGFDNFGVIGWSPRIITTENGNFSFDVIDYNKSKCKIIIEGMTPEGELFQTERIVELK